MPVHHFFPGSNTPCGFVGRFDHILPAGRRKRLIVLKGGPGVGKSTFMRRMGETYASRTECTEYFHCSSDPHSLDAIAFVQAGVCFVDGTSPHIVDPALPGAADSMINLGAYLDEPALEELRVQIEALQGDISAQFDRSACCLRACAALCEDTAATYARLLREEKLRALLARIEAQFLPVCVPGAQEKAPRELFLTAYTPEGFISLVDQNPPVRIVSLVSPWGADVSPLLRALLAKAVYAGLQTYAFLDPLFPDRPAHLYLPDENILFTTLVFPECEAQFDLSPLYDPIGLRREEELVASRRVTFEMLERSACDALREAHSIHDDLEALYTAHMDFALWQERFDEAVTYIERYFK